MSEVRHGVSLLLVGDELLDGRVHDTNSHWLTDALAAERRAVHGAETVPDRVERIVEALRRGIARSHAVIVTGGLGPTPDDLTRDALAEVAGQSLVMDDDALRTLAALFAARGRTMADTNRQQCLRPTGATFLDNPVGTAPALWQVVDGVAVLLLPGVPAELRAIWADSARTRILERVPAEMPTTVWIRTTQIAESTLAARVRDTLQPWPGLDLAYCVAQHGVDVLVRSDDPTRLEAARLALLDELSPQVFAEGGTTLAETVVRGLIERGETVAVAESCTGGMVGEALTSVPGSSACVQGGVLAYANAVKERELGVDSAMLAEHGAVSEAVAAAMARGARERFGVDWAVATTGVAGPGGGTPDKPVGTVWVARAGRDGQVRARQLRFGGDRSLVRRWTVAAALDLLRLVDPGA